EHRRGVMKASAGWRVETGVKASDVDAGSPWLRRDERLDLLAPVSGQQQEALESLGDVDLDDVPDDRAAADLDQRLGDRLRVLLKPRAATPAQDRDRRISGAVHAADYPFMQAPGSIRPRCRPSSSPRSSRPTTSAACTEATWMRTSPSRSTARS